MYSWSILLYAIYHGDIGEDNLGAIFRHPDWNAEDIFQYIAAPALDCFYVSDVHFSGNPGHLGDQLGAIAVNVLIYGAEAFVDPTTFFSHKFMDNSTVIIVRLFHHANGMSHWNYSWTYFLSPSGIDELYTSFRPDSALARDLNLLRMEVGYWYLHTSWPKPYQREFYAREEKNAVNMKSVYRTILNEGTTSVNYTSWPIARKAGVLGGIYELNDTTFNQQPGVFKLYFTRDDSYVYTTQDISVEGHPDTLGLSYDVVTFGDTRLVIRGTLGDTFAFSQIGDTILHRNVLAFNAQEIVNNGPDTVYFEVQTANWQHPNQFAPMFSSDYREVYNRHPEIYTNPYYDSLFVGGNPVRTENQNPIQHPEVYWPYILPLNPVLTALNTPSDVTIDVGDAYNRITLNWTDRSRYNSGYEIQRIDEDGNVRTITINDSNATQYVDYTVSPFHTYHYKIRAINSNGLTSNWAIRKVYNTPTFTVPFLSKVFYNNGKEYIAFGSSISGKDGKWRGVVIVLKSSPDGIDWVTEDTVYQLITDSVIRSFDIKLIPVDFSNGVKFVGLATYSYTSSYSSYDYYSRVDVITYSGVGHHGVVEVFSGPGTAHSPGVIWNREDNNVGLNFVFFPDNSSGERVYWAEYTLSNNVSLLGYIDVHELFNTYKIISLSPLKVDGIEVAEFPWGVVLTSRTSYSENEIIALYGDDAYSYAIIDTTPGWMPHVSSDNNRVVWVSEDGLKEAVIGGIADMIWVDRKELINSDISGDNTLSLDYSQNSYGDEIVGVAMRDTGSVSKFIVYTRAGGSTQWSLRNVEVNYEFPVIMNGQVAFADRYRGRDGVYQKYLTLYRINADTAVFKERAFKVREEVVIGPDISRTTVALIHNGDSNYIFFSRYGYVDYVK